MDMLIGLLGGESSAQIVNIVLDILAGAGYDLTPAAFKSNVNQLASTIDKAVDLNKDGKISWNEVVKANSKYQYVVKNDKGEVTETLYADEQNLTTIDGKNVVADWVQKQTERRTSTDEKGNLYTEYLYTYSVEQVVDGEKVLVPTPVWLKEAGKTEWVEVADDETTADVNEEVKHLVKAVMENTDKQTYNQRYQQYG